MTEDVINDIASEKKFDPEAIPNKVKMHYTLVYNIGGYDAGQIKLCGWEKTHFDENEVMLTRGILEADIPVIDGKGIKTKAIETLEQCKQDMQARHYKEMRELQDKIDSLMAIEYQPTEGE